MFDWLSSVSAIAAAASAAAAIAEVLYLWRATRQYQATLSKMAQMIFKISSQSTRQKLGSIKNELPDLLELTKEAMEALYAAPISASVKVPAERSADGRLIYLRTLARDRGSSKKREVLELEYPLEYNAAFSDIANGEREFYINNDIGKPEDAGYYNTNERWNSAFKSALVVPIKTIGSKGPRLLGLLTFDSPRSKVFDERALPIAQAASEMIAAKILGDNIDATERATEQVPA